MYTLANIFILAVINVMYSFRFYKIPRPFFVVVKCESEVHLEVELIRGQILSCTGAQSLP